MIPEKTTAVIVTYPAKGWGERIHRILQNYYRANGFSARLDSSTRQLIMKSGTVNLRSLTLGQFRRQGCSIKFVH